MMGRATKERISNLAFVVIIFLVTAFIVRRYSGNDVTETFVENKVSSELYSNDLSPKPNRRISVFFGTRPEIIKVAPLITELKKCQGIQVITIFTGQHSDIIQDFLKLFDVHVDIYFENIMQRKQSINQLFGKIMLHADTIILDVKTDIWVVQGDTSSALAIAMVAFHRKVQIAHLEAGLRTYNMHSPFPEEFNRKTISSIATYNFAPTKNNVENLIKEGIDKRQIFLTGNTVIDATKYINEQNLIKKPDFMKSVKSDCFALLTIHRRENFYRIHQMYSSISKAKCKSCVFITPVHPNPSAGGPAKSMCKDDERFLCLSPIPYQELHWIMKYAKVILTDSGGIQEEVTWYNTPTIILRNSTERPESIQSGIAKIVPIDSLPKEIDAYFSSNKTTPKTKQFPFGNGNSAKTVADILITSKIESRENVIKLGEVKLTFIMSNNLTSSSKSDNRVGNIINKLKEISKPSISVIIQVYKRNSLAKQLESIALQTLKPKSIVIIQNEFHVNISGAIKNFRNKYKDIELVQISSSKNLRYHGRFHIAYLQTTDYVSVWDDDIYAERVWLEYSVQYSKNNGYGLVGANCRNFKKIDIKSFNVIQNDRTGKCDFVGHIWTLPRQLLIFYIEFESLTYVTGEDVQLAFALQKQGINCFKPPMSGKRSASDMRQFVEDQHASFKVINPGPRMMLFCSLLLRGFKFVECENCNNQDILKQCVMKHKAAAAKEEIAITQKDYLTNEHTWT